MDEVGRLILETWKVQDKEVKVFCILRKLILFHYGFGKDKGWVLRKKPEVINTIN